MFDYIHGIIRPDGRLPLVGDADGSQIVPMVKRDSDDVAYLLAIAALVFDEPEFTEFAGPTPELLWLFGEEGVERFHSFKHPGPPSTSTAFPNAGSYAMRDGDLYLLLNANDTGTNGRGSHAHNDALSIEVSAYGRAFIVDPGSYVYNLDREARHEFRSTAYHSTITVDSEEQNLTFVDLPFVLGNQAKPKVMEWRATPESDVVIAEHYGYTRLDDPVIHRRSIEFDKTQKYWSLTDDIRGNDTHEVVVSFHVAPGVSSDAVGDAVILSDAEDRRLLIRTDNANAEFSVMPAAISHNYGHREDSSIIRWRCAAQLPLTIRTIILPVRANENLDSKLELLRRLADNTDS
jgi:hypothetical protein